MKQRNIALYGLWGQGNIGNDCTLETVLHNIKLRDPEAKITIVCSGPDEVSKVYDHPTVAIKTDSRANSAYSSPSSTLGRLFHLVFRRLPAELLAWREAFRALDGTGSFMFLGSSMLTDYHSSAFGHPYTIFKWSCIAKIRRCKLYFVSVGVGPVDLRLSRFFIKAALKLADFRSYRDKITRIRLEEMGFKKPQDSILPDLVFSMPQPPTPMVDGNEIRSRTIGVGIMDWSGLRGQENNGEVIYNDYLDRTCNLIESLVKRDYLVSILHGDVTYDTDVRAGLREKLSQRGFDNDDGRIVDHGALTIDEIRSQIAKTSLVISPRFHNLIFALMFGIPVISISYDPKNNALLESFGQGDFCHKIDEINVGKMLEQVETLGKSMSGKHSRLIQISEENRKKLDDQYDRILADI